MNNLARIGMVGLSLAFAGAVLAEGKPGHAEFGAVDQNRDGRVSKVEAQAYSELTSQFGTLDADRDTYLSQVEFGKWKVAAPGAPPPASYPDPGKAPGPAGTTPQPAEPRSPVSPQSEAGATPPAGEAQ